MWNILNVPSSLKHGGTELLLDTLEPALQRDTDQVENLAAKDALGSIQFRAPQERRQADATYIAFQPARPFDGPVHVSYDVPVATAIAPKRGPHIDLQAAGGGISGAMVSFLLLPELSGSIQLHVHWNLPPAQLAVTSYGVGDGSQSLTLAEMKTTLFMAGPLKTYPAVPPKNGISFYGLGVSEKELAGIADRGNRIYEAERAAFQSLKERPFRFFVRSYEGGPITSGRADVGAFMLYLPSGVPPVPAKLDLLIAHEFVHSLIKDLDDAPGEEGDWYTEGTADYFALQLPHRAKLYSSCEYLAAVNGIAAKYYTNSLRSIPNSEITKRMWSGRNAWTVPYARGALYFANLDAQLRARRSGVSVIGLVNEVSRRVRAGQPANNATWVKVLNQKLGKWAVSDWRSMLKGHLLIPVEGAFDGSLHAYAGQVGYFDLGFASPKRLNAGAQVEGVRPGSPASQAGLRNGDVLTQSVDLNPFYESFRKLLTLQIQRHDVKLEIRFQPYAGSHSGYRWKQIDKTAPADARCAN